MAFFFGYERAATCVADLSIGDEFRFDGRTVFGRIDDSRPQRYLGITRSALIYRMQKYGLATEAQASANGSSAGGSEEI